MIFSANQDVNVMKVEMLGHAISPSVSLSSIFGFVFVGLNFSDDSITGFHFDTISIRYF